MRLCAQRRQRRRRTRTNNGCSQPQLPRGIFQSHESLGYAWRRMWKPSFEGHARDFPRETLLAKKLTYDERHWRIRRTESIKKLLKSGAAEEKRKKNFFSFFSLQLHLFFIYLILFQNVHILVHTHFSFTKAWYNKTNIYLFDEVIIKHFEISNKCLNAVREISSSFQIIYHLRDEKKNAFSQKQEINSAYYIFENL